ncbi:SRPBCC family protein [Mycolicibacterium obuense]|uniref:Polyketide cyclase n=1 Tax=Mycolicibacterium obuense TaxID=1807 RepID=A0A0M2JSI2_9MYCO|nr:SRPBCC family protein [Mycolicibacterium obuense]KKE99933.1 polyketide cyclase [Mycolicibacterium obuense]
MHACARVGLDFLDSAPYRIVSTVDLAITPAQLFEVLADENSWPRWATVITKVTWTSPPPRGVGTTRTVTMRGGIAGNEEFLAWDPFERMAFRFNEVSTSSMAAFAEDYRVVPTSRGCHLTWTMALQPANLAGRIGLSLGAPVMNRLFQRFLHNLRRYTDERFSAQ